MLRYLGLCKDTGGYMAEVIEFPSGAALQIEKDKMKARPVNDSMESKLIKTARFYVAMNGITGPDKVYTDNVANTAIDFVKEVCEIVGYHKAQPSPTAA